MNILPHQNAASSVITLSTTAAKVYALIDTAGSVSNSQEYFTTPGNDELKQNPANGLILHPVAIDIRLGHKYTPTATLGMLLVAGKTHYIPNLKISDVELASASGTPAVSIEVTVSHPGESLTVG